MESDDETPKPPEGLVRPLADDLEMLAESLAAKVRVRNGNRLADLAVALRQTVKEGKSAGSSHEWLTALLGTTVCVNLKDTPAALVVLAEIVEITTQRLSVSGRALAVEWVASIFHDS